MLMDFGPMSDREKLYTFSMLTMNKWMELADELGVVYTARSVEELYDFTQRITGVVLTDDERERVMEFMSGSD